jgi:DNA-binding IclR family transcriptional regulator
MSAAGSTTNGGFSVSHVRSDTPRHLVPRILLILECLGSTVSPLSASDVARKTAIPIQTTHRILWALAQSGLTNQEHGSRNWTLGPLAIKLGAAAKKQISAIGLARPFLARLAEFTGETVILTLRHESYATYVDIIESRQPLRLIESVGMRLPLTVGSSRRTILAFLDDAERKAVLTDLRKSGLTVDRKAVEADCQTIRRQRYAISVGTVTPHTFGLAVPIMSGRAPVGSITVAGPESRMRATATPKVIKVMIDNAASLSALVTTAGAEELIG